MHSDRQAEAWRLAAAIAIERSRTAASDCAPDTLHSAGGGETAKAWDAALRGVRWGGQEAAWSWPGERAAEGLIEVVGWLVAWMHGEPLRQWVLWLTGEPAGLKLNAELGHMLGGAAVDAVNAWEAAVTVLAMRAAPVLVLAAACSWLGVTFALACANDALSVVSLHLWALQRALASLHASVSAVLATLWLLFQGRKRNPLRGRVDSIDPDHPYAAHQLLVGTLLFACAFLIAPTVAIFYAFFSAAWVVCLALSALLWALRTLLSDLPAAGIAVRAFFPLAVPASLRLRLIPPQSPAGSVSGSGSLPILSARLESVPASSTSLLWPYLFTLRRLASHYHSADVIQRALRGEVIPGPPDEDEAMLRGERAREASSHPGRDASSAQAHGDELPPHPAEGGATYAGGDWLRGLRRLRTRAVAGLRGLRLDIEGGAAAGEGGSVGSVLDMPPASVFTHDCVVLWLEATRVVEM